VPTPKRFFGKALEKMDHHTWPKTILSGHATSINLREESGKNTVPHKGPGGPETGLGLSEQAGLRIAVEGMSSGVRQSV
jgi:hypothetical protein